jgi:predicted metalloprotease with PDZ domain
MIVLGILLLRIPLLLAQESSGAIALTVDVREAPRGILHAQLTIPVQPGPLTLLYPKWIPGEHGPTGPIRDLVGLRLTAGGREIPWQRDPLDMYAFRCEIPAGTRALEVSLDFLVPVGGSGFTSGASTTPHLAVISWNQLVLYPQGRRLDALTYSARLLLPAGWKAGTALRVAQESPGSIQFRPVLLTTLVDSPVIAGEYFHTVSLGDSDGVSHQIHIVSDSEAALEMPPEFEASLKRLVAEAGALFGARHYTQYHFLLTLSEHVAQFGLEHHESSDNRMGERTLLEASGRRGLGGLLSHEYIHSWNGKYRRPAGLIRADFQQPMETDLLWVYEGLTSYLEDVLAARSGLWSAQEFRDAMARVAASMERQAGRTWRPLVDTAVAAQTLYGAGGAWSSWRRGVDFYPESELIWLEADVILRQESQGRYSLDDFCRRFHGGQGGAPAVVPYRLEDVVATLTELVPYDWKGFFAERVDSTSSGAPLGGLENGGWRVVYRDTPPEEAGDGAQGGQGGGLLYSLGMTLRQEGVVGDVVPDLPAAQAGLAPGMKLVAVNGRRFSNALLRQAIKEAKGASEPIELLTEDREFFKTFRVDYHDGERFPALERDSSKPDLLEQIIQSRGQ